VCDVIGTVMSRIRIYNTPIYGITLVLFASPRRPDEERLIRFTISVHIILTRVLSATAAASAAPAQRSLSLTSAITFLYRPYPYIIYSYTL